MSFEEYPKYKYHPKHDPRVVNDRDAEDELGEGWYDTPGEAEAASPQQSPPATDNTPVMDKPLDKMTKAELVAFAAATHDLELDPKATKDELLAKIQQAVEAKLATQT